MSLVVTKKGREGNTHYDAVKGQVDAACEALLFDPKTALEKEDGAMLPPRPGLPGRLLAWVLAPRPVRFHLFIHSSEGGRVGAGASGLQGTRISVSTD